MKVIVGITCASGVIYGVRLLEELQSMGHECHLVVSSGGWDILQHETGYSVDDVTRLATCVYDNGDLGAAPASGSFIVDAMVVVPCSMKTLSAIANGYGDTLISRAASCCLKEAGRRLVVVPRETPLELAGIENMRSIRLNGGCVLPAMPGFYHEPKKLEDIVDFVVGKILDQLGITHELFTRWN